SGGEVVVALASGTVLVLTPDGERFRVAAQLQAQGGVPALPSAVEVLRTSTGQLQVLVSSQGSDTIFVFAAAASSPPSPPGQGPPPGLGPPPTVIPTGPTQGVSS